MDGQELKEVMLSQTISNKDFRIDSAFYTTDIYINPQIQYLPIGKVLNCSQYGASITMNESNIGYPIYRMNEIHNMLCDISVSKCAKLSQYDFRKFVLNDGDVLFNRTNSFDLVGRTGVYYNTGQPCVFASYLVRFVPNNEIVNSEYLATFLSTKFGIADIRRRARQSVNQTNVNPEEVKEMLIPILDVDIQEKIKALFLNANRKRIKAQKLYEQAELQLLKELQLDNYTPTNNNVVAKTFYDSFCMSGRLDAEYYQQKYDDMLQIINEKSIPLKEVVNIKKSIEPGSDEYLDEGIPFVRVADVTKYGIEDSSIYLNPKKYSNIGLQPRKNTILLSKDGSVGIAYKVENDLDIITSGALLHLVLKSSDITPEYLTLVLNSIAVTMQAERDAGGSIIQHWKPSEIENVRIPIISYDLQEKISAVINESFELRAESKVLLEKARRSVEIAIEEGQEQAKLFLELD